MKYPLLLLSMFLLASRPGDQALRLPFAPAEKNQTSRPKNLILLIGDGMGLTQITAAMLGNRQQPLQLERFPVTGLIKTFSSNNLVTDSGAGATAFACGCKTYNGAIGVFSDKKPCPTILETAERQGLATGLVATSSITHATPAAFIAHVPNRTAMEEIATWFVKNDIDLFIGGGEKYFNERASDTRNLRQELEAKGYFIADFSEKKLGDWTPSAARPFGWFSAKGEPVGVQEGRDYLPTAARIAPEFLKQRSQKGFFLMLEGSQIDWFCHGNNAAGSIAETLDFDKAIGQILDFAQRDGETLVVLTADHETGGMAILHGSTLDSLDIKFNTDYHTATMVPVFAYGPGAEAFSGVYENTEIYWKMRDLLGFPLPEK